jgi:hypothetical protein
MEEDEQNPEKKTSENKDNNSNGSNEIPFSCIPRIKEPYKDISFDQNRKK